MDLMPKIKTSLFSRSVTIAKMLVSTQVSEVKEKLLNLEGAQLIKEKIELATKLTEKMSELRGATLKIGQLLSLDAGDFLPKEAVEILQRLQKDVEPIDFGIVKKQFEAELGDLSKSIDLTPNVLAVASIGQVHLARYKNQEIALKIQYPEIRETIPRDIKILRLMLEQWTFLFRKSIDFELLLDELESTLLLEADYLQEQDHLIQAHEVFKNNSHFLVPKVFPEISTGRILAMERMYGLSLSEWIKSNPPVHEKQKISELLIELFLIEFFSNGFVQTDPNPGNFLITPDKKIVLLDFGATKKFDQKFREFYLAVFRAAYEGDKEKLLSASFNFNLISPRESEHTKELYCKMMFQTVAPFKKNQPFNFADQTFNQESKENVLAFIKSCQFSAPPQNIVFLQRKLGGIFQLIRKMDVSINLHHYWIRYLS
jgi:predicted unusual protein kinase regulating ubiquinone biosynthesis (AarF/ABC1/UbiB family)